jgi:DNA-binding response OmpR family regulator
MMEELLKRWLLEAGYAVLAPEEARETPPALVIADVPEPKSAPRLVSEWQRTYRAPVVVLSGRFHRGLETSARVASQIGAAKVLAKPFTRREFVNAVRRSIPK